jgi:hypothetical protein
MLSCYVWFRGRGPPVGDATLLLRTNTYDAVDVTLLADGAVVAVRRFPEVRRFTDERFVIPGPMVRARTRLEVRIAAGHNIGTFHYFVLQ